MIVVDTNVILAFLITDGVTRKIITSNKDVFMTPEHCFKEVWEHRNKWNRHKLSDAKLHRILEKVKKLFILPVKEGVYKDALQEASKLICDPDDVPVIALAISADNEGIWTYDVKHFDTKKIKERLKILGTKDILRLYPVEQ